MRATVAEVGWTPAELAAVGPAGADVARPGFVRGCPSARLPRPRWRWLVTSPCRSVATWRPRRCPSRPGWRAIPTTSRPASRRLHHRLHRFPWTGGGGPARAGIAAQRGRCHPGSERQRVLRLLVKHVLINPDKITIRHSIPSSCQLSVRCPYRPATIPWSTPTSSLGCDRGERGSRSAQLVRASGVQHSPPAQTQLPIINLMSSAQSMISHPMRPCPCPCPGLACRLAAARHKVRVIKHGRQAVTDSHPVAFRSHDPPLNPSGRWIRAKQRRGSTSTGGEATAHGAAPDASVQPVPAAA